MAAYAKGLIQTGRFPYTAALFAGQDPRNTEAQVAGMTAAEARFERGLQALLDGAALHMGLRPASDASGTV